MELPAACHCKQPVSGHYPAFGRGRQPYPLSSMLRVHLMQQWFGYADEAMEEALIDQPLLRRFAGLDAGQSLPDETTILRFRRMLEENQLAPSILGVVNGLQNTETRLLVQGFPSCSPLDVTGFIH